MRLFKVIPVRSHLPRILKLLGFGTRTLSSYRLDRLIRGIDCTVALAVVVNMDFNPVA